MTPTPAERASFNQSGSKYLRAVPCITDGKIDVYAVLDAFAVTCPARQHAIKKLLCTGIRGKGDSLQDLKEAADAITRAIQMERQKADWHEMPPLPGSDRYHTIHTPLPPEEVDDITAHILTGCQKEDCTLRNPAAPCNCALYGMAGATLCQFYQEAGEETEKISNEVGPFINCADCSFTFCPACGEQSALLHCDSFAPKSEGGKPKVIDGAANCANHDPKTCADCYHCQSYEREQIAEAKEDTDTLSCGTGSCQNDSKDATRNCLVHTALSEVGCASFTAEAKEPQPLDLSLPTVVIEGTRAEVLTKFNEEMEEYSATSSGSMSELLEAWDVIQVAQTYRERGGCSCDIEEAVEVAGVLTTWHSEGRPVLQAKRIMTIKNAARSRYSDEDNARILANV